MLEKLIQDKRLYTMNINSSRPLTIPKNREIIKNLIHDYTLFNKYDILFIAMNLNNKQLKNHFVCKCGNFKHQKLKFCSRDCKYFKMSVVTKMEETCLKTFGVKNAGLMPDHKQKMIITNNTKYGKNWYTQTQECKDKTILTNLEKYGTKSSSQSEIVKEKARKHFLSKYGKNSYVETEEFKLKRADKMVLLYGTTHALQNAECKEKGMNTCLKNHGVRCYLQSKEINDIRNNDSIQQKRYETMNKNNSWGDKSIPEEKIYLLLKDKFKNVRRKYKTNLYPFPCDFYIPESNMYIEIHFSQYHHFKQFEKENINDLREVLILKLRSILLIKKYNKIYNQYEKMIDIWTNKDPKKLDVASKNNLNFKCFYNYEEFFNWYNNLK